MIAPAGIQEAVMKLGPKRFLWSYDFKSLQDNGATLTFGSDIPGISTSLYLGRTIQST
jgi:predicted amidohydrolase YtcJ